MKLTVLLVSAVFVALALSCASFVTYDVGNMKTATQEELSAVTGVVAANIEAAVLFDDTENANELLSSLSKESMILRADIFIVDRQANSPKQFATYARHDLVGFEHLQLPEKMGHASAGYQFTDINTLRVTKLIKDGREVIGLLTVVGSLDHLNERLWDYATVAFSIMSVVMIATILLSLRLQRVISSPITKLAKMAEAISEDRDYSVRVESLYDDEIGALYSEFNNMLAQVEAGERELQEAHDRLEERVQQRTRQLSMSNIELTREIAQREQAQKEIESLQAENLETARQAGMAEIATSVLHNVGNVLNSVNVSSSIVIDRVSKSKSKIFVDAMEIVREHLDDIGGFVTEHPQGKHLAPFLIELSEQIVQDEEHIISEIRSLNENVAHIKDIVSVQQSFAGISGLTEVTSLKELIEHAIRINEASLQRHEIEIIREFDDVPNIVVEKNKVLQVLVNLISNAKNAVKENDNLPLIKVTLKEIGDVLQVKVIDNGSGIEPKNITKIFAHGFTTRSDGHGFGLHSSALTISQMDGKLEAQSDGPGKGAEFIIELPLNQNVEATPV